METCIPKAEILLQHSTSVKWALNGKSELLQCYCIFNWKQTCGFLFYL